MLSIQMKIHLCPYFVCIYVYILLCGSLKAGQLSFSILKLGLLVIQVVPNLLQFLQAGQN